MPTSAELKSRSRELAVKLNEIMENTESTAADKKSALEAFQKDFDAHQAQVDNSERAADLRSKLGANPSGSAEETLQHQAKAFGGDLAQEIIQNAGFAEAHKAVGGRAGLGARGQFRTAFEVGRRGLSDGEALSLKDSTAANNQMGEGLYGGTGPTALGQNPFLTGAAGPAIWPHQVPGIVDLRFAPLPIEALFTSSPTESPSITYLIESLYANNAAEIPEAGQYPYSSDEWSRAYEQVGKIGNMIKLTDETLQDADQFVSFVQGRLVMGVQRKKEVALLAGSGYPGVNGLLARSSGFTKVGAGTAVSNVVFPANSTPGAAVAQSTVASLTYGRTITGASGVGPTAVQIAEGIYGAITDIMYNAFVPADTILINPLDWQTVRLAKDGQGQYLGGSFFGADYGQGANAGVSLWGKRVIETPAIPAGTILVGSFSSDVANIFRRTGLSVEMSNNNGTDFEHGLVSVRAEERLALAVYRPAAFELIQLKNGA